MCIYSCRRKRRLCILSKLLQPLDELEGGNIFVIEQIVAERVIVHTHKNQSSAIFDNTKSS